jgi:hypothetical protein
MKCIITKPLLGSRHWFPEIYFKNKNNSLLCYGDTLVKTEGTDYGKYTRFKKCKVYIVDIDNSILNALKSKDSVIRRAAYMTILRTKNKKQITFEEHENIRW